MHSGYKSSLIRELRDQQVRFAPRVKRLEQAERAEKLSHELEGPRVYPYDFLCFRVTDYRPENPQRQLIKGRDAAHDLRLFVEDITDSLDMPIEEAPEKVHTLEDLTKLFNVSAKTISRWRDRGLVSRRYVAEGRKRLAFHQSSVERFVSKNRVRIERGERFSQLSVDERKRIIDLARELAAQGLTLSAVSKRLSQDLGRSGEAIRYTIKNFDRENPSMAVFPDSKVPLSDEDRAAIFELHRRGTSLATLACRYDRSVGTIHRLINEQRALRIAELKLDFIPHPDFTKRGAADRILADLPRSPGSERKVKAPKGLPPYLASLYDVPLLDRESEHHLFRKMNFLKYRASKLREQLSASTPKISLMNQIEKLHDQAVEVKNLLVQSNLRLVVSIAKRHVGPQGDMFALISDGNMSLIRAVDKFDCSRGNKFSTYATWAVMKNFARSIPNEFKHQERFLTSGESVLLARQDDRSDQLREESMQEARQQQIQRILSRLDEREQQIIIRRFGLDYSQEPLTLKEVGEELGVTKERIRQLETRALNKLREAAQSEQISPSE